MWVCDCVKVFDCECVLVCVRVFVCECVRVVSLQPYNLFWVRLNGLRWAFFKVSAHTELFFILMGLSLIYHTDDFTNKKFPSCFNYFNNCKILAINYKGIIINGDFVLKNFFGSTEI